MATSAGQQIPGWLEPPLLFPSLLFPWGPSYPPVDLGVPSAPLGAAPAADPSRRPRCARAGEASGRRAAPPGFLEPLACTPAAPHPERA